MQDFFVRRIEGRVNAILKQYPAVMLTGARQVGKTTLAHQLASATPNAVAFDLDKLADRLALGDPAIELLRHAGKLIIIDEVQRIPELFSSLRAVFDETIRRSEQTKFMLLGSVTHALQEQSENLVGRLTRARLHGIDLLECSPGSDMGKLWNRGGFPKSYLAESDEDSLHWRNDYIDNQFVLDVAALNSGVSPDAVARLLRMLAAIQGGLASKAELARKLRVSQPTVERHIRLLKGLMLISELPPYFANISSRLVKTSKYYICDSGLMNALNNFNVSMPDSEQTGNLRGASWEGFVIENLRSVLPRNWRLSFFRTESGDEMDLVIEKPDNAIWAAEIKTRSVRLGEGNRHAQEMLKPERTFLIHGGDASFSLTGNVDVIPLADMMILLLSLNDQLRQYQK